MKLNDKSENGDYPLLWACYNENIEMINLLIDYANKNNIILKLNGKQNKENYPFHWACWNNNIEIIFLLIDYANKNNLILEFNESDYENNSKIKNETIEIIKNYRNEKELENLVIVINNFKARESYQLGIKKNELLIVTDWNCVNIGWVYGYRKNNKEEKGMFPEIFIKRFNDKNIGKYINHFYFLIFI